MPKYTQEDADHVTRTAAEQFGDLVPEGKPATPELLEHVEVIHAILMGMSKSALAGALAGVLVQMYGKGSPLIARRMVEVYGAQNADG